MKKQNLTQKIIRMNNANLMSLRKELDQVGFACNSIKNYLEQILQDQEYIKERLSGQSIGKTQEILTLNDLKRAYPHDGFSDETADKHGTDIVATVRESGMEIGQISISVKHHKKWNSKFIGQLEKNIKQDGTRWGFLVSTAFPSEALNDKIWTAFSNLGLMILIVKPEYAPVGYYAFRTILIYEYQLRRSLKSITNKIENDEEVNRNV